MCIAIIVQWCRKQIRSGEDIGSRYGSINIVGACKAPTIGGSGGMPPQGKF